MRVAMTTRDDGLKDSSRAIRAAEALARAGHQVDVYGRRDVKATVSEVRNGVIYHSLPLNEFQFSLGNIVKYFLIHLKLIVSWIITHLGQGRILGAVSAAWLLVLLLITIACLIPVWLLLPLLLPVKILLDRSKRRGLLDDGSDSNGTKFGRLGKVVSDVYAVLSYPIGIFLEPLVYLNEYAGTVFPVITNKAFDVIHSHGIVTLSGGYLAALHLKCPLIYDAHEYEKHTVKKEIFSRWTMFWQGMYEKHLSQCAKAVVTVTDKIAHILSQHYNIPKPVVVMNSPRLEFAGTDSNKNDKKNTIRKTLGLPADTPLALYVGGITPRRNIDVLVRALIYYDELHLAALGPCPKDYFVESLVQIAQDGRISDRFHIINPVPSNEVVTFIGDADVSVIPYPNTCLNHYYCFPNKLMESSLAGLPIIGSDLYELRRFIERFGVGFVLEKMSPKTIAKAIRKVVEGKDQYKPGNRAFRNIVEKYGWAAQEKRLLDLYTFIEKRLRLE